MRTIPSGLDRKEAELYSQLDPNQFPKHVAIIMDGNGRWAKRRHLPRIAGHRKGVDALRRVVETASNIGLPALTLYAFSAENFTRRPPTEIHFLMKLLHRYLKNELPLMERHNVRLSFIGRSQMLPQEVQERMAWAKEQTAHHTGTVMTLALNYGSRSEIVDACKSMVAAAASNGGMEHLKIDEESLNRHMYTSNLPELDLIIRTSGEMRLSNFLLWQAAYAEIYVTKTLWPDFSGLHLLEAIQEFQKRERRYGGLNEPYSRQLQLKMKRVLTAVVLIPVVLLLLFKAPDWLYSGFIGLIAVLAAHEYFGIASRYQQKLHTYVIEAAIGVYFLGQCFHGVRAFGIDNFGTRFEEWTYAATGIRVLPLVLVVLGMFLWEMRDVLGGAAFSYFGFIYLSYTLGALSIIGHFENGRILVFIFLIIVWSGDIFAYYAGRAFGKHKLAETISPKKTWEGAAASTIGGILVSVVLFRYIHSIGMVLAKLDAIPSRSVLYTDVRIYAPVWWLAAVFGLLVNIAAQLGDLAESALKRGADVKDSGTLLPGHGGVLDRIDALLFAAPVLWFFDVILYRALIHHP